MKITCAKENIKDAVAHAERVTGKNLALPVLSLVLLIASESRVKLRATNLDLGIEVSIPARVEKEGIVAIPGSILSNFLSNLYGDENVSLESINNNLALSTSKTSTLIKTHPYEDFPTIPIITKGAHFTVDAHQFVSGLKSVYYSAAVSDVKPEFSSVYIYSEESAIVFVATDSSRLAEKRVKIKKPIELTPILVPLKNVTEITRILEDINGDVDVYFTNNQISFHCGDIYVTSRLIDGVFPDYKQLIPGAHNTQVVVLKQDLINALKLTNVFSGKLQQIVFKVYPDDKAFEVESKNMDIGESTTSIDAALSGEDIEMRFNQRLISDALQAIPTDSVSIEFSGPNKPLVLRGVSDTSFTYLVMPLRD